MLREKWARKRRGWDVRRLVSSCGDCVCVCVCVGLLWQLSTPSFVFWSLTANPPLSFSLFLIQSKLGVGREARISTVGFSSTRSILQERVAVSKGRCRGPAIKLLTKTNQRGAVTGCTVRGVARRRNGWAAFTRWWWTRSVLFSSSIGGGSICLTKSTTGMMMMIMMRSSCCCCHTCVSKLRERIARLFAALGITNM